MSDSSDDEELPQIRQIEEESVRRIVAGQAVTDLASAVKELVDNSLDANSKSINIRLFNQGIDIVEVSDDGDGVPRASRPFMATPHATSKIRCFEDIYQDGCGMTMGFRGEALFCLANLSHKLMVATRTYDEVAAQKMEFKRDGSIDTNSISEMHRKVGTTVAVMKLLDPLPVRRKDLVRRIQKHKQKLMRMMEGYAIFSVGVRISLIDMTPSYQEKLIMATSSTSNSVEENISSVMGSQFLSDLSRITVDLSSCHKNDGKAHGSSNENGDVLAEVQGFISSAQPQRAVSYRQQNQRIRSAQFFSINGRPVEMPQVSRAITDAWRPFAPSADGKKRPSCVFCFTLPNSAYDINLSPEKRQVILTKEKEICELLHEAVTKSWSSQTEGVFKQNEPPAALLPAKRPASLEFTKHGNNTPDSARKRHRRRGAFVHDFNKAKMQHEEMPAEEKMPEDDAQAKDFETKKTPQQSLDNEDEKETQSNATVSEKVISKGTASTPPKLKHASLEESPCTSKEAVEKIQVDSTLEACDTEDVIAPNNLTQDHPTTKKEHLDISDESKAGSQNKSIMDETNGEIGSTSTVLSATATVETTTTATTTIRKVSNDKFTSAQDGRTCEELGLEQPKTVSPMDVKTVSESDHDLDRPEHIQQLRRRDCINTDGERRRWNEMQSRFNCSENLSQEQEIQALIQSSKNQVSPDERDIRVSASTHVEKSIPDADSWKGKDTNFNSSCKEETRQSSLLNFNRFSFRRVSNDNINSPQHSLKKSTKENSTQKAHVAVPEEKLLPNSAMTLKNKKTTKSPPASPTEDTSRCQLPQQQSQSQLSQESESPPETVHWGSFQGTKDVVMLSRQERTKMIDCRSAIKRVGLRGSDISHSGKEKFCETELKNSTISLSKGEFAGMTVIGQFNLGFILAKCRNNHLWILDQHACDEKFNFEHLMKNTIIHEQRLIAPMPMELSPNEESCILDNMEIFEKNGFRFDYNPDQPPRHRMSLTALPHSGARDGRKAVQFGKEDVSALCNILGAGGDGFGSTYDYDDSVSGGTGVDGSGIFGNNAVRRHAGGAATAGDTADKIIKRLPKAVAMFASRACRSSIMIGKALSQKEMEKVVKRLDEMDNPWSCAHGRPTMSHVGNLHPILLNESNRIAEHIAGPTVTMMSQDVAASSSCDEDEKEAIDI